MTLRAVIQLLPIVLLAQHAGAASAPAYPTKPIRIITSDPGGTGDLVSRLIAPGLSRHLGQQVVVDNRTGNVIIPAEMVARATPDGHTMIAYGGTLWLQPLMQRTPYDPIKDFSAITLATSSPCLVVVHPAVAAKSVKELIALAISVATRCDGCIAYHARNSVRAGATRQEIAEMLAVTVDNTA